MRRLREIAEAASPGPWGVLAPEFDGEPGWVLGAPEGNFRAALLQGEGEVEDVGFAATFDPPTVLALLDVAEASRVVADDPWEGGIDEQPASQLTSAELELREALARLREATQ